MPPSGVRVLRIAIFTDHDFDRINGITTTLTAVLRHAPADFKPRIYTFSDLETDERDYLALKCPRLPVPGSSDLRFYLPRLVHLHERMKADDVRVVHVTTPGPSGLAGRYLARRNRLPLIGSLHAPLTVRVGVPADVQGDRWIPAVVLRSL